MKNDALLDDFKNHLLASGLKDESAASAVSAVRKFLKAVGASRLDRISEAQAAAFFMGMKSSQTRTSYASSVSRFLKFAVARLPVPVKARGEQSPRASAVPAKIRERWSIDKAKEEKRARDDVLAQCARKLTAHYLFFRRRLRGAEDDLEEIARFADECRDLIEQNLPLFMELSAQGYNINSVIDERVQRRDSD